MAGRNTGASPEVVVDMVETLVQTRCPKSNYAARDRTGGSSRSVIVTLLRVSLSIPNPNALMHITRSRTATSRYLAEVIRFRAISNSQAETIYAPTIVNGESTINPATISITPTMCMKVTVLKGSIPV